VKPDPFATLDPAWDSYRRAASWTGPYLEALEAYVDRFERLDAKPAKAKHSPYREGSISPFREVPVRLMEMVRKDEDEFSLDDQESKGDSESVRKRDLFFEEPTRQVRDLPEGERGPRDESLVPRYVWLRSLAGLLRQGRSSLRLRGGPGTGKTWVTRLVAADLIGQFRLVDGRIPLWVSASGLLNELENHRQAHEFLGAGFKWDAGSKAKPVADCIAHAALKELGASPKIVASSKGKAMARSWGDGAARRLAERLLAGNAVLIVDALDQCGSPARIREIVEAFCCSQESSLLVTGRPYAVPAADPKERVRTLETVRWNLVQIAAYGEAEGLDLVTKDGLAEAWRRNSSRELVAVPQLLAFVVEGIKQSPTFGLGDFLSQTKFQLFQKVLGIRAHKARLSPAQMKQLAGIALAHWRTKVGTNDLLYVNRSQLGRLWKQAIEAKLIGRVASDGLGDDRAEWSHRAILEFLAGHAFSDFAISRADQSNAARSLASLGYDPGSHELLQFAYGRLLEKAPSLAEFVLIDLADNSQDDCGLTRLSAAILLSTETLGPIFARTMHLPNGRWFLGQELLWEYGSTLKPKYSNLPTFATIVPSNAALSESLQDLLGRAVADQNWHTVVSIASALGRIGDPKSNESLIDALNLGLNYKGWFDAIDPDKKLSEFGDSEDWDVLTTVLDLEIESENWFELFLVAETIGVIGDPTAIVLLGEMLNKAAANKEWNVVASVAKTIGKFRDPESTAPLLSALNLAVANHQSYATKCIVRAINHLEAPYSAVIVGEALSRAVTNSDWGAVCDFARVLGQTDARSSTVLRSTLKIAIAKQLWSVVRVATHSLVQICGPSAAGAFLRESLDRATAIEDWVGVIKISESLGIAGDIVGSSSLCNLLERAVANKEWGPVIVIALSASSFRTQEIIEQLSHSLDECITNEQWAAAERILEVLETLGAYDTIKVLQENFGSTLPNQTFSLKWAIAVSSGVTAVHECDLAIRKALEESILNDNWEIVLRVIRAIKPNIMPEVDVIILNAFDSLVSIEDFGKAISVAAYVKKIGNSEARKSLVAFFDKVVSRKLWDTAELLAKALGNIGESLESVKSKLNAVQLVRINDAWFWGLAEHPDPIAVLQNCPNETAFLDQSPGTAFRFYSSLVRNLPANQPRHWHEGRWKTTAELVQWDQL